MKKNRAQELYQNFARINKLRNFDESMESASRG